MNLVNILLIHLPLKRMDSIKIKYETKKIKYETKKIVKFLNKFKLNNINKLQDVIKAGALLASLILGVTRTPKYENLLKKAQ